MFKNRISIIQAGKSDRSEPGYHWAFAQLKLPNGHIETVKGISLSSPSLAMKKCLMEAEERYCLFFQKPGVKGSASHTSRNAAILHALYEAIERDAKMLAYYGVIKAKRLSVSSIHDEQIRKYQIQCDQREIKWYLYEIVSDLEIPTYLTILASRAQGKSTVLSFGAKAGHDGTCAILSSLEEALAIRPWLKKHIQDNIQVNKTRINTPEQRVLLWTKNESAKYISFLLKQDEKAYPHSDKKGTGTISNSIKEIINSLVARKIEYSIVPIRRTIGHFSFAIRTNGLQGVNLPINEKRMRNLVQFFGYEFIKTTKYPHPFI